MHEAEILGRIIHVKLADERREEQERARPGFIVYFDGSVLTQNLAVWKVADSEGFENTPAE
jgi:hypothetical protein